MRRLALILVIGVLIGGLLLFDYFMGRSSFVAPKLTDLNGLQQKQVDVFLQMTSLLAGFATLALGGIGALIWDRKTKGQRPTTQLLIAAATAGLSLFFGYLSLQHLVWMLNNGFLDFGNQLVSITSVVQFVTFFASIVALSDYVFVQ